MWKEISNFLKGNLVKKKEILTCQEGNSFFVSGNAEYYIGSNYACLRWIPRAFSLYKSIALKRFLCASFYMT